MTSNDNAVEMIAAVFDYLKRFEGNLSNSRDQRDEDWRRGACFVRDQVIDLIRRHVDNDEDLRSAIKKVLEEMADARITTR